MAALNNNISILGCGWYGLELAKELIRQGFTVKGSTTSVEKLISLEKSGILPYLVNFHENGENFDTVFFDCNILVISIPPKRSLAEQHTFIAKIERISAAASTYSVPQIIFISSSSVYGDHNAEVTESILPSPDTASGQAILSAEKVLQSNTDLVTTIIRFGGLIGPDRDPGRFFAGKKDIANGKAPVNLIHLTDCIGITTKIIERQAFGYIYNACSADHPSRELFYTSAARRSGLEQPLFIDELLKWKIVKSINIPTQLDYHFEIALNSLVLQ